MNVKVIKKDEQTLANALIATGNCSLECSPNTTLLRTATIDPSAGHQTVRDDFLVNSEAT